MHLDDNDIIPIYNKILRNNFIYFLSKSVNTIHRNCQYEHNWHIDAIAKKLNDIEEGVINRLIINIPPRYLKSTCISVAWPAWLLGHNPMKRIIVASYSKGLSIKHNEDCKIILNSDWYKSVFPKMKIAEGRNTKSIFYTEENGFRMATSIGGTLTGEGGDILIADDPLSPIQAMSEKYRNRSIDWFRQTFSSRLNDKKNGAIIIVSQRLHEYDLIGFLQEENPNGWDILNLPLIASKDEEIDIGDEVYYRKKGEILNEKREGLDEIKVIKNDLGQYAFSAQYQQDPIPVSGNLIKASYLKELPEFSFDGKDIVQSWDTANIVKDNSDYSVCTTWLRFNDMNILLDVYRGRLEYIELREKVLYMQKYWNSVSILIENKGSGQQLIQELKDNINVISITPYNSKEVRVYKILHLLEKGEVYCDKKAYWYEEFIKELLRFPKGKHDDQVDSMSQYLNWIYDIIQLNNSCLSDEFSIRNL